MKSMKKQITESVNHAKERKTLVLLICGILFSALCFSAFSGNHAKAKTYTSKSQVNKELKKLKAQKKKLTKQYKAEKKKETKQRKGGVKDLFGTVISTSPLIIKQPTLISTTYYWVTGGTKNVHILLTGHCTGAVKPTGKTKTYKIENQSYTCTLCKGVKVTNKSYDINKKLSAVKLKIQDLSDALKNKVIFNGLDETLLVGDSVSLSYSLKYWVPYNKVTFQSSNKAIASVTSDGTLTAKKAGTVTITATCSISKNKVSRKITIGSDFSVSCSKNGEAWQSLPDTDSLGRIFLAAVEGDKIQFQVTKKSDSGKPVTYQLVEGDNVTLNSDNTITCNTSGTAVLRIQTENYYHNIVIRVEYANSNYAPADEQNGDSTGYDSGENNGYYDNDDDYYDDESEEDDYDEEEYDDDWD